MGLNGQITVIAVLIEDGEESPPVDYVNARRGVVVVRVAAYASGHQLVLKLRMLNNHVPQGPVVGLVGIAPLNNALDVAVLEVGAPLHALAEIRALLAAMDKAVGGVVLNTQARHFAEDQLPLLRGADVVVAHHAVDNGGLHAVVLGIGHNVVKHLDGGGNILIIGDALDVVAAAQVVLGSQVGAKVDDAFHVLPLFLRHIAVLVQNMAGPAAYRAHFHAGALTRGLQLVLGGQQVRGGDSEEVGGVAVKLHKVQPQFLCPVKAFRLWGHNDAKFHKKSSLFYMLNAARGQTGRAWVPWEKSAKAASRGGLTPAFRLQP